ncbi:MAG: dienelactone hydrolase family protein [Chromatiales bacterium]|jgi:dienelactone hydrolase
MRQLGIAVVLTLLCGSLAWADLQRKEVEYSANGTTMKGYLVYDESIGDPRPGVLVVHEWWGQNAYARKRAEMLAELGYVALAVDMYGDGQQATHPEDAGKFASAVRKNMDVGERRFLAAKQLLSSQPQTDPDRVAAIGYCFGGGVVLEMARRGVDLDGVVSFHGSLTTEQPARAGEVKAGVLVLNGADDPFVKPEQITAFEQEMSAAGVEYEFINYPGALHSFTNPEATENGKKFDLPLAYDAQADQDSWKAMQGFLDRVFAK